MSKRPQLHLHSPPSLSSSPSASILAPVSIVTTSSPPPPDLRHRLTLSQMARLLAQTLTLARPAPTSLRGLATKVEVIEIDLSEEDATAAAAPSSHASSVEAVGIRRLEEAIHGVMVRRATPDWLPFVPGRSFWVPPVRRPQGVAELMGRIAEAREAEGVVGAVGGSAVEVVELDAPMTEEEALSFSTARGWPSASYFVEGKFPSSTKRSWKGATQTDDEES